MRTIDSRRATGRLPGPTGLSVLAALAVIVVVVITLKPEPQLITACGGLVVAFGMSLRYIATATARLSTHGVWAA